MPVIRLHLVSTLDPKGVLDVLTDFSPSRARVWPTIDADHFEVHGLGDTWAEVTEGTAAAWERARYEWEPDGDTVTVTTLDSRLFGAGGGWVFRTTTEADGTRVDVELTHSGPARSRAGCWQRCCRSSLRRRCASRSPGPSGTMTP